jgi:hypothetical protein
MYYFFIFVKNIIYTLTPIYEWGGYIMLYFLLALFFIMLLLYLMPVAVSIDVNRDNENDKITIGLKTLYGLLKLKTEIPFLMLTFENGKPVLKYKVELANRKRSKLLARFTKLMSLDEGEGMYKAYRNNKYKIISITKYLSAKIRIRDLYLKLSIGTGDAAATGLLYGILWIVLGSVMTYTRSCFNINEPRITVVPIFGNVQFIVDFSCIISMKLGHIINAGIRAMPVLLTDNGK